MATWFTIEFEGEPTEADFTRVAELAAQGCTSGQLINDEPQLDCPVCGGKHFEQAGIENCAADHEMDYPYDSQPR